MKHIMFQWEKAKYISSLLVILIISMFSACNDIEDTYIEDTQLSVLQKSRTSLVYLLRNSTFGTAPGTYPTDSKDILNVTIAQLDHIIARAEAGEIISESELESALAQVNKAIDDFKASKYYNLSDEAKKFIEQLLSKADALRAIINNASKWGNHKGQYPVENKIILETAATNLESLAKRIENGSITNMTQEIFDEATSAANEQLKQVEDSAWPDNSNITWNLFVDGNADNGNTYLDFGFSEDYIKFGEDDNQSFTIELWVNIKEYCNRPGEDNSTFLNTLIGDDNWDEWSGWRAQCRMGNLYRTMVAHWEDDNHTTPRWWEPGGNKHNAQGQWTHYAFLFADNGLPWPDTQTDVKAYSMIDGSRQGEVIRVGEPYRHYINHAAIEHKVHMTGFCKTDKNGNRNEWFSGSIKKIRLWRKFRTEEQVNASYRGYEEGVTADNEELVDAWELETKGEAPEGRVITGLKGHKVTICGDNYRWVESTELME